MLFRFTSHAMIACALALVVALFCATQARGQDGDEFGDDAADPVQLFKRAQELHARGQFEQALALYDAAIKVRPEFPEAFFQRGNALVSLNRFAEAEKSFQRAIELRANWVMPQAALGALLLRLNRTAEAEKYLEGVLKLEEQNAIALVALTNLRLRAKAAAPVLENLLRRLEKATTAEDQTASLWVARAALEKALGKNGAALTSLNEALSLDSKNLTALMDRSELYAANGDFENAIKDARSAQQLNPQSINTNLFLADTLARAGRIEEALKVIDALDNEKRALSEVMRMRKALSTSSVPETEDAAALEKLLDKEPRNAPLLARLCVLYRTENTERALGYCRRALDVEPANANYATAYAAALVRAKRFEEAVQLLRQILARAPDNYTAHTNLATALFELKRFQEALNEYDWIIKTKPDLAVVYFFIGAAHDQLGQYTQALEAYQKFLERADLKTNQLEIDKVNLRLPPLRNQIKRGEGVKNKKE